MATFTKHTIPDCPYVTTQKVLSGKWSIIILHLLEDGDVRFNELHRQIEGISQATLTKQLRQLEEDGLITRKVYPQVPPKVEYNLSDLGKEFTSVLAQINIFGQKYIEFVKEKEN